jgi:hypothetical protein
MRGLREALGSLRIKSPDSLYETGYRAAHKKQALVVLAHQLDDTLSDNTDLSVKKRHLLDNLRRRLIIKWQRLDG